MHHWISMALRIQQSGRLHCKFRTLFSSNQSRSCAQASLPPSSSQGHVNISIPNRIERGPTDILKALASTVQQDLTAPHYKYVDDPFLIPMSSTNVRAYALSKESGRKAARYFLDNYPQLFYRDDAEPKVPAFSYKDSFNPETQVDQSDLIACIECRQVGNAIQVYENCLKQEVELSQEAKLSLLQFLCFFNSQDAADPEYLEEKWFQSPDFRSELKKHWLNDSVAEKLYRSLPAPCEEAVNAMICGYSRFNDSDNAIKLYEEAKSQNIKLDVDAYNGVLKMVQFAKGNGESRWDMILNILRDMKETETRPDVGTLTEILSVLSRQQTWKNSKNMALKVTAEMKRLGIEPSLAALYFLLQINTEDKTGGANPQILYDIMDYLTEKSLEIRHPKDVFFFAAAMKTCCEKLSDLDLAYKIHELLCIGQNNKLIGDAFKRNVYYRNFVGLMTMHESIDGLMEFYEKYIPNTYVPDTNVLVKIIEAVTYHEAYQHLPTLWSDMVFSENATRDRPMAAMIKALETASEKNEELRENFVVVIKDLMERFEKTLEGENVISRAWTAENLSGCLQVCVNGSRLDLASQIMDTLSKRQKEISGFANPKALQSYCQKCIETGSTKELVRCLKYCADVGNDIVLKYASELLDQIPDDDHEKHRVKGIVSSFAN